MNTVTKYRSLISRNYRKIVDFKNLDVCPIIATIDKFPYFKGYLTWFNESFPGLVHPCPYRDLLIFNASLSWKRASNDEKLMYKNPNGNYISEWKIIPQLFLKSMIIFEIHSLISNYKFP